MDYVISDKNLIEKLLSRQLSSGLSPIESIFTPVFDCYYGEVSAYRAFVRINSVISGALNPAEYGDADVSGETLINLAYAIIGKAADAKKAFQKAGIDFKWISFKVPSALLKDDNFYNKIKIIFDLKNTDCNKICLEFDVSVMETSAAKLARGFSDIKAAGLTVAVNGYGGEKFPMEKLLKACPDYLFTDKSVAQLSIDREKRGAIAPIINFARSLGAEVIPCGIVSDEQLREFKTRDCAVFLPEKDYRGNLVLNTESLTIEKILKRGEVNV